MVDLVIVVVVVVIGNRTLRFCRFCNCHKLPEDIVGIVWLGWSRTLCHRLDLVVVLALPGVMPRSMLAHSQMGAMCNLVQLNTF